MKIIALSFVLIFCISTNLFSWHYNCRSELTTFLFDDITISGKPFLIFTYKNILLKLFGDEVITQTQVQNKNTLINVKLSDKKYSKLWIELPHDDLQDYVDFEGKLFLEDSSGSVNLLRVTCLGQKVIR